MINNIIIIIINYFYFKDEIICIKKMNEFYGKMHDNQTHFKLFVQWIAHTKY